MNLHYNIRDVSGCDFNALILLQQDTVHPQLNFLAKEMDSIRITGILILA
jgi:hypothetical protein